MSEERITGLQPAFGNGKRWCVEGQCDHPQHPYVIALVGDVHVLYGDYSGGGAFPIGHREINEQHARLIAAAPEMLEALEEAIPVLTDAIEDSYCGMHRGRGLCDCKSDIVARISTIIARTKETPNA